MTTEIKVNRDTLVKSLSAIKEDNVSIADIAISRRKLLEALKLQAKDDAITITYGKVSWLDDGSDGSEDLKPEPCIQFSCNHTIMRFLNRPKWKSNAEPSILPLNFVDFHEPQVKPELTGTSIDSQALLDALTFVQHGIAVETDRPILNCICFDGGDDTLTLASADGFRLPVAKITANGIPKSRVLIHSSDVITLIKFLKGNTEGKGKRKAFLPVYFDSTGMIKFSSEKGTLEFQKPEGAFPDYPQLIPKDGTKIEFIASELLQAVKAVRAIAKDGSDIIRMVFNRADSKTTLSAKAGYDKDAQSSVECNAIVEADCKTAINAKYLIDLLQQCGDTKITLKIDKPHSPMLYQITDRKFEVIMPMFVQWDTPSEDIV